jgi:hypothetical protein
MRHRAIFLDLMLDDKKTDIQGPSMIFKELDPGSETIIDN